MVSWLTLGSKNWPQTSQSPVVTLLLLEASVFSVSLMKSHSAISQSAQPWMVWTLCLYGFSTGCGWLVVLCYDNITPCVIGAKKVELVGAIFTSSKHLLAPPWQISIFRMHRLDLVFRRVQHRHHIGGCLCSSSEDVSVMRRWCIVHLTT